MTFDEYQKQAWSYALPTAKTNQYLLPGLAGEVGELQSLFAKCLRDRTNLDYMALPKELGDILWFVSGIAMYHGLSLSEIADKNIEKLESRKQRNTIQGSGDER
jgi:NTP pyrophosphatase (non-canonical NTP hydrolase)